ncbi:cob(I)yrinic acid a,c-diamide adenosyltransferase [Paenibacillus sp. ACRRX]|uniref:cob(I)yrinic acid a,c-diamide adenosyltransferase n=1 Tax=unclassified Paenibacillus TaxID=185978 RepID=UPI001EF60364|nr:MULTISPECIES: cob(I)yrinic acid a,c-diamide adenosyltransferase [unclassified Paenibacillus]MCG7408186.1 cob(I)yrinic acid a,c-diamide adenosyltransferase [Paenibacillus sp. ACRRX]MDK8181431.1 cob(I)yrinic acid a,c-diamide adenosyltransferase [Paenibacillus sp. UMB4589-SE434]
MSRKSRGLVLVYTGDGKGKTTAAVGLSVRAVGRGFKVLILQFIKSPSRTYGEQIALEKIGVEVRQLGIGFTWLKTPEEHRESLAKAWSIAKQEIQSDQYDFIILDELNNALAIDSFPVDDVLPLSEVVDVIQKRPEKLNLIITGRSASPAVIAVADLVSEVQPVKHYYDEGIPAVLGLEF